MTIPGEAAPLTKMPLTIESVLDELLAGKITREEAAARIRDLTETTEIGTTKTR
jgi:hypothetical protein